MIVDNCILAHGNYIWYCIANWWLISNYYILTTLTNRSCGVSRSLQVFITYDPVSSATITDTTTLLLLRDMRTYIGHKCIFLFCFFKVEMVNYPACCSLKPPFISTPCVVGFYMNLRVSVLKTCTQKWIIICHHEQTAAPCLCPTSE